MDVFYKSEEMVDAQLRPDAQDEVGQPLFFSFFLFFFCCRCRSLRFFAG
jgi:hypothetical protein